MHRDINWNHGVPPGLPSNSNSARSRDPFVSLEFSGNEYEGLLEFRFQSAVDQNLGYRLYVGSGDLQANASRSLNSALLPAR